MGRSCPQLQIGGWRWAAEEEAGEGPSAGCRQQQLPRLVSPTKGRCLQAAARQPTLSHRSCGCMQPRRGGGGRLQKIGSAKTFLRKWLLLGFYFNVSMEDLGSKNSSSLAAFAGCPWEGQGYTALLLPRRPAAGPEKLRGEMPADLPPLHPLPICILLI